MSIRRSTECYERNFMGSHVESRPLDRRKTAAVAGKMWLRKTPWRREAHFWNVLLWISSAQEFKTCLHHWSRHSLDAPINRGLKECRISSSYKGFELHFVALQFRVDMNSEWTPLDFTPPEMFLVIVKAFWAKGFCFNA